MTKEILIQNSLDLINISDAVYLSTIDDDGFPRTRAMLNLRNKSAYPALIDFFKNHQFETYFTTNTSSIKIKNLFANSKVSVYYCKPDEWRGLMIAGTIETVNDKDVKKNLWQKGWELYYPKGYNDSDYSIILLKPVIINIYHQLNFLTLDLRK